MKKLLLIIALLLPVPAIAWDGYFEFMAKPGTSRSLGQADMFVPLAQDEDDMFFFNLRGQLDDFETSEYNIGMGHRHLFPKVILGAYVYMDNRNLGEGKKVSQGTFGFEALSHDFDFRMNGYLPGDTTLYDDPSAPVLEGERFIITTTATKALNGFDSEIGYRLPLEKISPLPFFQDVRLYAGGYHFIGDETFKSISGPRLRLEARIHDLPFLGLGSRLMIGTESQYDEVRGSQTSGVVAIRIPFGLKGKTQEAQQVGLHRRMVEPVVRDIDIVTTNGEFKSFGTNSEGEAYRVVQIDSSYTVEEVNALAKEREDENIVVFMEESENQDPLVLDGKTIEGDYTFALAGKAFHVSHDGVNGVEAISDGFIAPGKTPTQIYNNTPSQWGGRSALNLGENARINGFDIDAEGYFHGIELVNPGKYYMGNITVNNAKQNSVIADGEGVIGYINHGHFSNGDNGVSVINQGALFVDNTISEENTKSGFSASKGGILTVTNSISRNNGNHGLNAQEKGTVFGNNLILENNEIFGFHVMHEGSVGRITNSLMRENGRGFVVRDGGTASADNVTMSENDVGFTSWGGRIDLTNSFIINNGNGITVQSLNGAVVPDLNKEKLAKGEFVIGYGYSDPPVIFHMDNVEISGNRNESIWSEGGSITGTNMRILNSNGRVPRAFAVNRGDNCLNEGFLIINGETIEPKIGKHPKVENCTKYPDPQDRPVTERAQPYK